MALNPLNSSNLEQLALKGLIIRQFPFLWDLIHMWLRLQCVVFDYRLRVRWSLCFRDFVDLMNLWWCWCCCCCCYWRQMSVDVDWEYEDITLERVCLSGSVSLPLTISVPVSAILFICMSLSWSCRRRPVAYISCDWSDCEAYSSRESRVCRSADADRFILSMYWDCSTVLRLCIVIQRSVDFNVICMQRCHSRSTYLVSPLK